MKLRYCHDRNWKNAVPRNYSLFKTNLIFYISSYKHIKLEWLIRNMNNSQNKTKRLYISQENNDVHYNCYFIQEKVFLWNFCQIFSLIDGGIVRKDWSGDNNPISLSLFLVGEMSVRIRSGLGISDPDLRPNSKGHTGGSLRVGRIAGVVIIV